MIKKTKIINIIIIISYKPAIYYTHKSKQMTIITLTTMVKWKRKKNENSMVFNGRMWLFGRLLCDKQTKKKKIQMETFVVVVDQYQYHHHYYHQQQHHYHHHHGRRFITTDRWFDDKFDQQQQQQQSNWIKQKKIQQFFIHKKTTIWPSSLSTWQ